MMAVVMMATTDKLCSNKADENEDTDNYNNVYDDDHVDNFYF